MAELQVMEAVVLVDDEDLELVLRYSWALQRRDHTTYVQARVDGHTTFMHRVVLGLPLRVGEVDHRDRNGLNNRKSNLRVVTHQKNMMNSKRVLEPSPGCGKGHPLDGIRLRAEGGRYCKTCNLLNKQRQRASGKKN